MPTVLYVAYYFPPLGGMGSIRSERFARALPRRGWSPVVVTPRRGMYHGGLEGWTPPPGVEVVRTPSPEISRLVRGAWRRVIGGAEVEPAERGGGRVLAPVAAGAVGRRLRSLVRDLLYVPDAQIGWLPFARRAGARRLARGNVDVVLTTSVPFTSHLVGRSLGRRFGVPWVAEFRDLWSGSQVPSSTSALRRGLDRRMERDMATSADAVVVTTDRARGSLLETWPELDPGRVHVVTNAWERACHPDPEPPAPDAPLLLVHAGTLVPGAQDPAPLLAAAAALEARRPGSVRVRALGPAEPWRRALERVGGPAGLLETPGLLPPAEVPGELARASAVLLLAPGPAFRPVILGKTFDWLASARPALAVTDPEGEMGRLLAESGGGILVARNDPDDLEEALAELLRLQGEGQLESLRPDPATAERYELDRVTARLARVLDAARERRR